MKRLRQNKWSATVATWLISNLFVFTSAYGQVVIPAPLKSTTAPKPADVYLNDSFEASEAMSRAKRLAERERWVEAIDLLQETIDTAADKLIQSSPDIYTSVREYAHRQIADWPAAGVAAYQQRIDAKLRGQAEAAMESKNLDALLDLFDRCFCSGEAPRLADTIGQLAMESENLALARRVYRRVIDQHPQRSIYAKRFGAMLAILSAMEGLRDVTHESDPADMIKWLGQERPLSEVLTEIQTSHAALLEPEPPTDWRMFGGRNDRNRPASSRVEELGSLWRVNLIEAPPGGSRTPRNEERVAEGRLVLNNLSSHPVVWGDWVLVQQAREVLAIHRNTGSEAWRYRADSAASTRSDADDGAIGWDCPTVAGERVFAVIPGVSGSTYASESTRRPGEIVCLEAQSGRLLWKAGDLLATERTTEAILDSAPIVRNGRVYLVGRRRRSFGFEDAYLLCLDANSGHLRFKTHLGSASTAIFGSKTATLSIAAMSDHTVYVCTNLGTIASVDGATGQVQWLRVYVRDAPGLMPGSGWSSRERMPWEVNPVFVSGGRVICLPTDSASVLVLDATNGRLLKEIRTDRLDGIQTLLGVQGDTLYIAGTHIQSYNLAADSPRWSVPIGPDEGVIGRGSWAGDSLIVPTRLGVRVYAVGSGENKFIAWPVDAEPGNLIALPDQLLVAGATSLTAYVRKEEIWTALRARIAADPTNPTPPLELAEIALRSGDVDDALKGLDEAMRRARATTNVEDAATMRRLFEASLNFAETLSRQSRLTAPILELLQEYAAETCADRTSAVVYRLRFGNMLEGFSDPGRALALYQQILRDRSLRELNVNDSNSPAEQLAGSIATNRIAKLIDKHGVDVYNSWETEARRWLESARTTGDLSALQRVVETFPNSVAAALALVVRADVLTQSGKHDEAARTLSRCLYQYPQAPDRPALLRKIADVYEHVGKREHAYRWLTKAIREFPFARTDQDGRWVTFLEYRERLKDVRTRFEPARPRLVLPLVERAPLEVDKPCSLLRPQFGEDPTSRWSSVFVHASDELRCLDAQSGKARWTLPNTVTHSPPELLVVTSEQALLATQSEVFSLSAGNGAIRWKHGPGLGGAENQVDDWEIHRFRLHAFHADRLVSVRNNGRFECRSIVDGGLLWSNTPPLAPSAHLRIRDQWITYPALQDERVVLCLVDAASGTWHDPISTDEQEGVEDLRLSLDGQALLILSRSIHSYDVETREVRWRLALEGKARRESIEMDMEALYLSDDATHLMKISLEDGSVLWKTDRLIGGREDEFTVDRQGNYLLVSTVSSILAVDADSGQILWRGVLPKEPRLVRRVVSDAYVAAVQVPPLGVDRESAVYFFDYRNASGILPKNGGVLKLPPLNDIRMILLAENSFWVQTATSLRFWSSEK
ncbi:MAG: PQQ-binding-like beta-propeller repeat protein [Planctomycetota bacterium]